MSRLERRMFFEKPKPVKLEEVSRKYSHNLQHYLFDREYGFNRRNIRSLPPARYLQFEREFYRSICPNFTIQNVDKPHSYFRKFTPDGHLLLNFAHDRRSLEVYNYHGVKYAFELLKNLQGEYIASNDTSEESLHVRQKVFEALFSLRWKVNVGCHISIRCHLNREFSIFLENGHYVLLAAVSLSKEPPPYRNILKYPDLYDEWDTLDFKFILIDLHEGCISDLLSFNCDLIMLSHNHGVSAYGHTLAFLSKYRQCIDIFELINGKLVRLKTVGPFSCNLFEAYYMTVPENGTYFVGGDLPFTHLKQNILSHLYREIISIPIMEERSIKLREFYKNFKIYENMIMCKVQLVDTDHLLIRYEQRPTQMVASNLGYDCCENEFKLYVFYSLPDKSVMRVFTADSVELLYLVRDFGDCLRNVNSLQTQHGSSSPSNNVFFKAAFNSIINTLVGGEVEAACCFNPTVPISTQSFSTSPYLDYNLFSYDDRLISALERPKTCSDRPICFKDRYTQRVNFRMYLEKPRDFKPNGQRDINNPELVAYIFHPYEPFAISVQKHSARYIVNFHIYKQGTVIPQ